MGVFCYSVSCQTRAAGSLHVHGSTHGLLVYGGHWMIWISDKLIKQWKLSKLTLTELQPWSGTDASAMHLFVTSVFNQAGDTRIPLPRKPLWTLQKNCRLQSWILYKSADCRWICITILCISFTNSATVGRLEQVQLRNRLIDQSADNITGLKCVKECLILKYKYNPESLIQPGTNNFPCP